MSKRNPSATSTWLKLLGVELSPVSHRERLVSALGGFVGIFAVYWLSHAALGGAASPLLVLSMGSTAVMLFAVHYLRCIHPPAGATALAAALGDGSVRAMGFGFVLAPVMQNVLIILAAAIAFNALFSWRRYPAALVRSVAAPAAAGYEAISHEDFVFAPTQMDSLIDVSEEDLLRIYSLATGRHRETLAAAAARAVSSSAPS